MESVVYFSMDEWQEDVSEQENIECKNDIAEHLGCFTTLQAME